MNACKMTKDEANNSHGKQSGVELNRRQLDGWDEKLRRGYARGGQQVDGKIAQVSP
jgi:hypothetical protein